MSSSDSENTSDVFSDAKITSNYDIPENFKIEKETPTPNPTNHGDKFPLPTNDHITSLLVPFESNIPSYVQPFIYTLLRNPDGKPSSISVSSAEERQKVVGDHYVYNPVGLHEMILQNLGDCEVNDESIVSEKIKVHLVQGQGMVTVEVNEGDGIQLTSQIGIRDVHDIQDSDSKCFGLQLNNEKKWILYADGLDAQFERNSDTGMHQFNFSNNGIIQLFPDDVEGDSLFSRDFASLQDLLKLGNYAQKLTVSTSSDSNNVLQFDYNMKSSDQQGLIFLLPHHQEGLKTDNLQKADLKIYTTVYGFMQGFYTSGPVQFDYSSSEDDLNDFDILSENKSSVFHQKQSVLLDEMDSIKEILTNNDVSECMNNLESESNIDSMYFAGKVFNKYAWLLFLSAELLQDTEFSDKLFDKITECLNKFIQNEQILPLLYDNKWGGIISSGDIGQDFGNSMYNDHHFHYGYFVLTFAILGWYKSSWLEENKFYSDLLLRDYCNIDNDDDKFVKFRNFNWFEGHSWANGVWPSLDGRDQESSSEDYNSVYAMFLYGSVTKNFKMQQIAKLQLNVMKRSNNAYFLYKDEHVENEVAIREMKGNKVCGIFFQNKIDYATYFGMNTEFIHMIHFIPGTFISRYIRDNEFVNEEWDQKLQNIDIDNSGWNGLLKLNRALVSSDTIDFFKNPEFNRANLDNGQSQTFSLILALLWNN